MPLPLKVKPTEYGSRLVSIRLSTKEVTSLQEEFQLVKTLGCGMFGIAYLTKNGKVLKLTSDKDEKATSDTIMYGFNTRPFATIYETGTIGLYNIFYILKEYAEPLSTWDKHLLSLLNALEISEQTELSPELLKTMTPEDLAKIDLLRTYRDEVTPYQLEDTLNVNNIGYNQQGCLVCFDPTTNGYPIG